MSEEWYRRQAKSLKRKLDACDPAALDLAAKHSRVNGRAHAPQYETRLMRCQHVIACAYGFAGWKALIDATPEQRGEARGRIGVLPALHR